MNKTRCAWLPEGNDLYTAYHDTEWGRSVYDDRLLFEMLILEGAQAGLSWSTVLNKRAHYKKVFHNFDVKKVATYDQKKIDALLQDAGIIRNKLKVNAAVKNAKIFLEIQQEFGSFSDYLWRFVNGNPIVNSWKTIAEVPVSTPESDALSKDLKKRGMSFVGSTIMYAFMQAVGVFNDHTTDCWCYKH
jgi:DNA-3-methyladenine glycosylase I